jgi:hypothetical protein
MLSRLRKEEVLSRAIVFTPSKQIRRVNKYAE